MAEAHNHAILRFSADFERRRDRRDHEGVITSRLKSLRQAFEQAFAVMKDLADFSVHQRRRANDLAAEYFADGLMPQADSKDRRGLVVALDNLFGDSRVRRD